MLHTEFHLGVEVVEYAKRISAAMDRMAKWANGEGQDEGDQGHDVRVASALATDDLMLINEIRLGEVAELRQTLVISEIYSPPRVTALLSSRGMMPGFAMDFTTCDDSGMPWDFSDPAQRQQSRNLL